MRGGWYYTAVSYVYHCTYCLKIQTVSLSMLTHQAYCCVWVGVRVCVLLCLCDIIVRIAWKIKRFLWVCWHIPHTAVYAWAYLSAYCCVCVICVRILLCMSMLTHPAYCCVWVGLYVCVLLCLRDVSAYCWVWVCWHIPHTAVYASAYLSAYCCVRVFSSCSMCPHPAYIFGAAFRSPSAWIIHIHARMPLKLFKVKHTNALKPLMGLFAWIIHFHYSRAVVTVTH